MLNRTNYFSYLGDSSSLIRNYGWLKIERYHYETVSGETLSPKEVLEFHINDKSFIRTFYANRFQDSVEHGPYLADKVSALGLDAYTKVTKNKFIIHTKAILNANFGKFNTLTSNEQHLLKNAQLSLNEVIMSENKICIFRLLTENMGSLQHDCADILDYFTEYILIDTKACALNVLVFGAD